MRPGHLTYKLDAKGFTVAELLIVIAIISVLLGLSSLYYNSIMDRLNAESQMKEMFTDLMNARVRAMQRNRTHFVVFSSTPSRYAIYEDTDSPPDGDGVFSAATDSLVMQKNLMPKFPVTWPNTWTPVSPLQFNAKGLVPTDIVPTGTVRISAATSGEYDCIDVSAVKITLGKWDATKTPPQCIAK